MQRVMNDLANQSHPDDLCFVFLLIQATRHIVCINSSFESLPDLRLTITLT